MPLQIIASDAYAKSIYGDNVLTVYGTVDSDGSAHFVLWDGKTFDTQPIECFEPYTDPRESIGYSHEPDPWEVD
jgi:hypothetical protein